MKKTLTVLVADDDSFVRDLLGAKLRSAGYDVLEAASGDAAAAALGSGAEIRVVVCDVRMPGAISSAALLQLVRSKYPAVRFVVMSGLPVNELSHEKYGAADGFISKPFTLFDLLDLVNRQMARAPVARKPPARQGAISGAVERYF